MKTFFVVNPKSANGATGKRWAELAATIARALQDYGVEFTKRPLDATAITRTALRAGYQCVVAVGGDGTINEVVNGFFDDGRVLNPKAALGVLPRGTGGDFRRTFDWDTDFERAVHRLKTEDTRPFDVGQLEFTGPKGERGVRYFANVCSFGVSGVVDQEANRATKALGGKVSFALASLRALSRYSDQRVKVAFDGGPAQDFFITTLAAGNGKYFGGGMKVTPDADVSDGLLDVTVWSGYGLSDFVFKSASLYNGRHVERPGTRTYRCKELTATSDEEVLIDCDGEQPGKLPATIRVLPSAIRLKV